MPKIHKTAVVDELARIADDVEIGPYCIVEADTEIGPGTRLLSHAVVRRYTTIGAGNVLHAGAVLGGEPQDYKFLPETKSYLRVGDCNVFREGVTISRATTPGGATSIGSHTLWMANSHCGHDSQVGDHVIMTNSAVLAGHVKVADRCMLSAYAGVHQFCWVGSLVLFQGGVIATMHVPPFVLLGNRANCVAGLNVVGMRRAGLTPQEREEIQHAFRIVYRSGLTMSRAISELQALSNPGRYAGEFLGFLVEAHSAPKPFNRGIIPMRQQR